MYKIERNKSDVIQLGLGNDVLDIRLGGLKQLKRYIEAQTRLLDIQKKLDNMSKAGVETPPADLVDFLGQTILYLFEVLFGEENTQKMADFFEGNYDEMLEAVLPFINSEVVPALKKMAKRDSSQLVKEVAGVSK